MRSFSALCLFLAAAVLVFFYYALLEHPSLFSRLHEILKNENPDYADYAVLKNGYIDGSDCERAINDVNYASKMGRKRVKFDESSHNYSMDCESIFRRWRGIVKIPSEEERKFPIAFSRAVFRDYFLQEILLHLSYSPQNSYCYVLDKKSPPEFRRRVRQLSECYPNVIVPEKEFNMDSAGHDMVAAHLHCMEALVRNRYFEYVILLQNHDVPIKSNLEMVRILRTLNGSNDITTSPKFEYRLPKGVDWSLRSLKLFKNASMNDNRKLNFTKGFLQASLSRAFVKYLFNELNVSIFLRHMSNRKRYGLDEMFFPTLSMDELGAPGGFTIRCNKRVIGDVTRHTLWSLSGCGSRKKRHSICIFGIEDLRNLSRAPALFANKLLPEFDYSAISCWAQYLNNVTHFLTKRDIDLSFYAGLSRVRFHNERERWRKNPSSFKC